MYEQRTLGDTEKEEATSVHTLTIMNRYKKRTTAPPAVSNSVTRNYLNTRYLSVTSLSVRAELNTANV